MFCKASNMRMVSFNEKNQQAGYNYWNIYIWKLMIHKNASKGVKSIINLVSDIYGLMVKKKKTEREASVKCSYHISN